MERVTRARIGFAQLGSLLALALAACTPSYDPCFIPDSVVNSFRVLAVRADPPEALVDLDAGMVPTVYVRALAAGAQDPQSTLQLDARACVPTADLHCPEGSLEVTGTLSASGATETGVALDVPASLIAAARAADPLHGYGGTRVQLEVAVTAMGARGPETSLATKTLLFSDASTTPMPNAPIDIAEVDVTLDAGLADAAPEGELVQMLVGHGYGLRPRLAVLPDGGSPLETYDLVDLSGDEVTLREQVSYAMFAENNVLFGDLPIDNGTPIGVFINGANLADEPQPGQPDPPDGLVRATPMLASQPRVWIVARDSRGATAWSWFDVRISDARTCVDANGNPCAPGKSCCADPFIGCQ